LCYLLPLLTEFSGIMTERILSIIKYLNLSPSDFAEEIGVQRSSISHLISGRNKPSLEFIQKILSRFPEINPEWILNGNGGMVKGIINLVTGELPFATAFVNENKDIKEQEKPVLPHIISKKKTIEPEERQVEKIIYLYKDKTFREYYPE
jgi:transcriptional regulator with XRE-family HTH domain